MTQRASALAGVVSRTRAARSSRAAAEFTAFRRRFNLEETTDALALQLSAFVEAGLSGPQIRERLQLLDLDRRLRGCSPWLQDPDVRSLLAGIYGLKPVGEGHSYYDPLYVETVHALVDVCRVPTPEQRRAHAARVLHRSTGVAATQLARLTWNDVILSSPRLDVRTVRRVGRGPTIASVHTYLAKPGDAACPVAAVRSLRSLDGGQYPFGVAGRPINVARLRRWLAAESRSESTPAQLRDPALLLLGYGAGLRAFETMRLRQGDVRLHDRGLVLSIVGRRRMTYLPSAPDPAYDPGTAWIEWMTFMEQRGLRRPDSPAFRATNFSVAFTKGMHESGLNYMIRQRALEAGVVGRHVWTSLRSGLIRTAIRNDERPYAIAAHVGLADLTAVQRHARRENLLGDGNIASRLGL